MKTLQMFLFLSLAVMISTAGAADGLIAVKSPYSAKETMDRFDQRNRLAQRTCNLRQMH